jgi:hypothetical protein
MRTRQSVEMTNFHKNNFSPWEQLTYMTINKHGGCHNLKTWRPWKGGKELKHCISLSFCGAHQNH